jgi:hypothetical protein
MALQYTTGKLPLHFFMLGVVLLLLGLLAFVMEGIIGIIPLLLAIPLLFTRSGIRIDGKKKLLKIYIALFAFQSGKWTNIQQATHLQIIRVRQSTSMAVLSIHRNDMNIVYKLLLMLPNEKIELLSGEGGYICKRADEISQELNLNLLQATAGIQLKKTIRE